MAVDIKDPFAYGLSLLLSSHKKIPQLLLGEGSWRRKKIRWREENNNGSISKEHCTIPCLCHSLCPPWQVPCSKMQYISWFEYFISRGTSAFLSCYIQRYLFITLFKTDFPAPWYGTREGEAMHQCNDKRHEEKGKVIIGCKSSYEPRAKIKVEEGRGFYNLSK